METNLQISTEEISDKIGLSVTYSLLDLPEEMFLHICSFLNVNDLVLSLKLVCKKFYNILQNENIFKCLLHARWKSPYIRDILKYGDLSWEGICFHLEKDSRTWSQFFHRKAFREEHISNVDAVLLFNNAAKCLSGSRDRTLIVWDIPDDTSQEPKVLAQKNVHDGWVWRLRDVQKTLYSASWDNTIKGWTCTSDIVEKHCLRCDSSVLCLAADDEGLIYGGCFNRKVNAFDPRVGSQPVFSYPAHRKSILTLDTIENDVISGSEDYSITVFDSRARKKKQRISLPDKVYPRCSQTIGNFFYIGDNSGLIRIYSRVDGELSLENILESNLPSAMTTINVSNGSVRIGSMCGKISICLALNPLRVLQELETVGGSVCSMDAGLGKIVVGTSSGVEFFLPSSA